MADIVLEKEECSRPGNHMSQEPETKGCMASGVGPRCPTVDETGRGKFQEKGKGSVCRVSGCLVC